MISPAMLSDVVTTPHQRGRSRTTNPPVQQQSKPWSEQSNLPTLIEDGGVVHVLERIVSSFTSELFLKQDLMQEALLHLWQTERERPNQRISWYLQSCRFRLQHYLAIGRSADSIKRRSNQVVFWGEDEAVIFIEQLSANTIDFEHASVRDIVSSLSKRLTLMERTVLDGLVEGLSLTEVARKLELSIPTVVKYRRKIARLAVKLGIICPLGDAGR